jgi:integrase
MPRTKKNVGKPRAIKMPKGFYLKKGIWYKRIHKPHPKTGVWGLFPESTHCKRDDRQAAIDHVRKREEELKKSFRLQSSVDPGKITMDDLFDDLLASVQHEPTKQNYDWVLKSVLRPYFGPMLASRVTVEHCRAFRAFRRTQKNRYGHPISHTTVNRDLSKVSQAFKIGMKLGKVHSLPPGGCDFHKKPETQNTRRVRLPDQYYEFFRDTIHPALRCAFVVDYNVGRRMGELLRLRWDRVDFDERCVYLEATKFGPGKAPFMGEMEKYPREQKALRDERYPDCPHVFFWFDYRSDKDGQRIRRFDGLWNKAVMALEEQMKKDGRDPIPLHFHDLRRSAHYQMRKAGIDAQTRRDIMGHESTSMDDRYTMIDDEALEEARRKMDAFQRLRGLMTEDASKRIEVLEAEIRRLKREAARTQNTPRRP